MKRRDLVTNIAAAAAGVALNSCATSQPIKIPKVIEPKEKIIDLGATINHSVCKWCYNSIPLEEFADRCKDIGISSIELLNPDQWDTVISRGLTCAISNGSSLGIPRGFNDRQYHNQLTKDIMPIIPMAADKGIPQIITFSGNRGTISDEDGLENCAIGLKKIVKEAEKYDVTIIMELLNSKVDHKDYMCDHTDWGVKLVEKVGSPNFRLLYDIYHMQIMEGDIIRTIRDNAKYISHYHTGGVPGRNEIDETQELYYPAIMKAIAETGYDGFVAQEFIPSRADALKSLEQGVNICNITL